MKSLGIFIIFSFLALLQARENPFRPVIDNTVLPVASNQVKRAPVFKSAKVSLPSDARVLTSIVIYYQSIDGSIKKRTVPVDRSIDWHKPIYISQNPLLSSSHASTNRKKRGEKAVTEKSRKAVAAVGKNYSPLPFLSLEVGEKRIKIVTKDEKIRSFHLSRPFKVAVDFKRKAGFLTKHIDLPGTPFKAIDIGNHDGYYRVVVTFDAPYRYKITKSENGYILSLP